MFQLAVLALAPTTPYTGAVQTRARAITMMPELANGKMSFDRVCREWRCKYQGDKTTSPSLAAIADALEQVLPKLKALGPETTVNRLVCGSCLDFKLQTTVPLAVFPDWEANDFEPEAEFLEKLKAIDGVSLVETQTITNMQL